MTSDTPSMIDWNTIYSRRIRRKWLWIRRAAFALLLLCILAFLSTALLFAATRYSLPHAAWLMTVQAACFFVQYRILKVSKRYV